MANSDVLFIVEGEVTEPKLIEKMNSTLNIDESINVYSYRTSIYELYEELKLDEDLDVALLLKSSTKDKSTREMLSKEFVAIYLAFDFEPHHQKFDIEKIIDMSTFFDDSLNFGLLLINYPMVESYKHLKEMPDKAFINRTVTKEQVNDYKNLVGFESKYTDFTVYHRTVIIYQIVHHLIKMNYLINGSKEMPSYEVTNNLIHNKAFIRKQHDQYQNDALYVLSTIYYYILELKPKSFYDELKLPNIIDKLCIDD